MRIIAGKLRGRKIEYEKNGLRPTKGRVREALFNILQTDIQDRSFLDLCCGSGSVGLEALSRGANQVLFVDTDTEMVKKNTVLLSDEIKQQIQIVSSSYENALDLIKASDIVFFDPPWELSKSFRQIFDAWLMSEQSHILILEHPKSQLFDFLGAAFQKTYSYGLTQLTVFRK